MPFVLAVSVACNVALIIAWSVWVGKYNTAEHWRKEHWTSIERLKDHVACLEDDRDRFKDLADTQAKRLIEIRKLTQI